MIPGRGTSVDGCEWIRTLSPSLRVALPLRLPSIRDASRNSHRLNKWRSLHCTWSAAISAWSDAISTRSDAISARSDAVCARSDAISAWSDAISARSDAISAWSDAVCARSDAISAWSDAVCDWSDAISARSDAVCTWLDAVSNRGSCTVQNHGLARRRGFFAQLSAFSVNLQFFSWGCLALMPICCIKLRNGN